MEGQSARLDFGPMALEPEDIERRVRQILPIVERLLAAEVTKMSLDDSTLQKRFRGIAAQDMVVDAAIWATALQAELLMDIVSGSESIADHGFPEFSDE
jgi:hypothetical protein